MDEPDNKSQKKKQLDDIMEGISQDSVPTPAPTPVPQGAVLNPNYVPGGPFPQFMPATAQNEPGLQEPIIDPINAAATVATGGLSSVGPMAANLAKNQATKTLIGKIREAAQARAARIAQNKVGGYEPATQIGQNSIYAQGTPVTNYQRDLLMQMRNRGKIGSGK